MIYLDANATTPVDPRVMEAMLPFITTHFANPSAAYGEARLARDAIARAREQVAALLDCEPDEIIFMSCGTESCNAALASALTLDARRLLFVALDLRFLLRRDLPLESVDVFVLSHPFIFERTRRTCKDNQAYDASLVSKTDARHEHPAKTMAQNKDSVLIDVGSVA